MDCCHPTAVLAAALALFLAAPAAALAVLFLAAPAAALTVLFLAAPAAALTVLFLAAPAAALTVLFLAAPAAALTVRIDFESFAGAPAAGWNVLDSSDSGATVDLFAITGADSGIDFQLPTVFDNAGAFDGWGAAPLPAWAPIEAADDYVYFFGNVTATITRFVFSGLDPVRLYDFDMIVSRDLARVQDMRVVGSNGNFDVFGWDSRADGYIAGNTATFTGVAPTAAGTINFFVRRQGASAALNAVQISSVPAPARVLQLGSVGLVLLVFRSRVRG